MPTYEYECKSCGHSFETFQSMNDQPLKDCPECGREIRRLIFGGTGVIFKGSGFYVTDKGKNPSHKAAPVSQDAVKGDSADKSAGSSADKSAGNSADKPAGSNQSQADVSKNSASGEKVKPDSKSA
ncbi:MAG: zinc ribbon domain-containing protein [Treponema sp.]|jgi:putative FmdB family regulatory protein|nr:zinc ribbon domain-containing protein [Treponema sp.]